MTPLGMHDQSNAKEKGAVPGSIFPVIDRFMAFQKMFHSGPFTDRFLGYNNKNISNITPVMESGGLFSYKWFLKHTLYLYSGP